MRELSEHTILMNIILGLVSKHKNFPHTLAEKGYQLESICPSFLNKEGKEINPDIILKSHEESNLFLGDCKTGTLQKEQSLAYQELSSTELREQQIVSLPGEFTIDISYICLEKNLEKIKEKVESWGLSSVILCKLNKGVLKIEGNSTFKSQILNEIFKEGINIPQDSPLIYYSFSPEDPEEYILLYVLPSILALSLKAKKDSFTLEELLRETHNLYDYLDEKEKKKLRAKVSKLLSVLERNDLKEFLNKVQNQQNTWEILTKRILSFRRKCQNLIQDYERILIERADEKKQTKLGEFSNKK